jgi:hypothetical protein
MKALLLSTSFALSAVCTPLSFAQEAPAPVTAPVTAPARVPAAMAVLVPDNATLFLMSESLNDLQATATATLENIMPGMGNLANLDVLLADGLPEDFDLTLIDHTRPIGFALGALSMNAEPQYILMLPTEKPDAVKQLMNAGGDELAYKASAGYLAMTDGPTYPVSTAQSPLIARMPKGAVAMASDLGSILKTFEPMISLGLDQMRMEMSDMATMVGEAEAAQMVMVMEFYMDIIQGLRLSATGLDVGLEMDGSLMDLRVKTHFRAGSQMAAFAQSTPTQAASFLPLLPDAQMGAVMAADWTQLMKVMAPSLSKMFAMYPDEAARALDSMVAGWDGMYSLMGDSMVMSGGFSPDGMKVAVHFKPTDFAAIQAKYTEMMASPAIGQMGLKYGDTQTAKLDDVELVRYTFELDQAQMMAMLGADLNEMESEQFMDGMRAVYGEEIQITLCNGPEFGSLLIGGNDDDVRQALKLHLGGRGMPPEAARVQDLARVANPFMIERIEVLGMMDALIPVLTESLGEMPGGVAALFESQSAPFTIYMGFEATSMTSGMMVDVGKISQAVMAFVAL